MSFKKLFLGVLAMTVVCFGLASLFLGVIVIKEGKNPWSAVQDQALADGDLKEIVIDQEFSEFPGSQVQIQTVSGRVEILPSLDSKIRVEVRGRATANLAESIEVTGSQKDEAFKIQLVESGQKGNNINFKWEDLFKFAVNFSDIEMRVFLPTTFQVVKVTTVSGDLAFISRDFDQLEYKTVSGTLLAEKMKAKQILLKSVSGDAKFVSSSIENAEIKTVSGNIDAEVENSDPQFEFVSVSGDGKFKFLNGHNFVIDFSSTSGDLDILGKEIENEKAWVGKVNQSLGNGKGSFKVKTTSGNLEVL